MKYYIILLFIILLFVISSYNNIKSQLNTNNIEFYGTSIDNIEKTTSNILNLGEYMFNIGDINGDNHDDIAFAFPDINKVYIVYGNGNGRIIENFDEMESNDYFIIDASDDSFSTAFGTQVIPLGSVNTDQYNDFAIIDELYATSPKVYIIYGQSIKKTGTIKSFDSEIIGVDGDIDTFFLNLGDLTSSSSSSIGIKLACNFFIFFC